MSKSVLVIDTPKNCYECKLCYHEYYLSHEETYCTVHDSGVFIAVDKQNKPDWCPLSPLPSYRPIYEEIKRGDTKSMTHLITSIHDIGYNECLDEILKGDINGSIC